MASRISPIVVVTNAARTTVQMVVVGALTVGAFAVLANFGYQLDPVVKFVNDALVRFVTG
jgi:hypothetical protein